MKVIQVARLAACMLLLAGATSAAAQTPNVMLSMNVFPTNLLNPNGGGTWRIVAKTDSTQGIAGISAYLANVSTVGLDVENDIGHDLSDPQFTLLGSAVNLVYGQNTTTTPLVGGVGTPALGDGLDPFGDPAWDNATRIFSGSYSSVEPLGYSSEASWQGLIDLHDAWTLALPTWEIQSRAQRFMRSHSLSFWDALILAACMEAGVTRLYSEDLSSGGAFESVTIVNPFAG